MVLINQLVVNIELGRVNSVRLGIIGIAQLLPFPQLMPLRCCKEGSKYQSNLAALILWPPKQRIPVAYGSLAPGFQLASFFDGARVIPAEGEHIPGEVLVGIDDNHDLHSSCDSKRIGNLAVDLAHGIIMQRCDRTPG